MKVLDLFAGIGGFSLAAHWVGWETIGFVEKDKYCQKVLSKNFPGVPIHDDIREYKGQKHAADIICGGFPCQPFSSAGQRKGKADDRYLWPEMLRIVREIRPAWVIGENVAGILSMDDGNTFEQICLSLEREGYKVQSFLIPAAGVGAPHRRDRVWIVANLSIEDDRGYFGESEKGQAQQFRDGAIKEAATDTNGQWQHIFSCGLFASTPGGDQINSYTDSERCQAGRFFGIQEGGQKPNFDFPWERAWIEVASRLCRVDDGLPSWVDASRSNRLKALGNAIVPQVALQFFKIIQIIESERVQ